jgi:GTP-binding protein EngB required for normal cell division
VAKKPTNSFFLVKSIRKKKDRTDLENITYARKQKVYATVQLPKITKENNTDVEKEVVELFNSMAKPFFHSNKQTVAYTYLE